MKKVLTYGTYDLFHVGHLNLLKRAAALGDHLTVAISTDEFNDIKGKKSIVPFEDRRQIVEALRVVDAVITENDWDQKIQDVINNDIDVFVIGDDWNGKFDFLKDYCEVVYLSRTPGISSTQIKETLSEKK